jgi:hypothetical protein
LGISTIRQLSGSANAIAPFSRHHGLSNSAEHHHLVAVRGGSIQLGQAEVAAVEVENLGELVGGTGDSDLDGGNAIGPDSTA